MKCIYSSLPYAPPLILKRSSHVDIFLFVFGRVMKGLKTILLYQYEGDFPYFLSYT